LCYVAVTCRIATLILPAGCSGRSRGQMFMRFVLPTTEIKTPRVKLTTLAELEADLTQ